MMARVHKQYDPEMIRDFLEHLLWEVRTLHYESTREDPSITHPELVDQLQHFQKKRRCVGLLHALSIAKDDLDDEQLAIVNRLCREARAATSSDWLEHLTGLETLFSGAFECAKNPGAFMVSKVSGRDIYDKYIRETDEEGGDS